VLENVPDLTVVAIPLYVLTMSLEVFAHWRRPRAEQRGYSAADSRTSLVMGLGSLVIGAAVAGIQLAFLTFFAQFAVLDLGQAFATGSVVVMAAAFLALFLLDDFCYYWFHRVHHESRFFWAAHVTHHSSQYYNLSTALRQSWTPLTSWIFYVPVMLVGFTPAQWAFMHALNLLYQYWIHTERIDRLPAWFEFVFNTPSHHRVHHGANPAYLDSNYGGILIIFDRTFGSFVAEREQVVYGLTKNIRTFNPVKVAWHEFYDIGRDLRRASGWRARWLCVFGQPGWTPQRQVMAESEARPVDAGAL
jgi:sterol desaturase/sphingolipid hydroxylase (fatty acid hydroxylase superfamily)